MNNNKISNGLEIQLRYFQRKNKSLMGYFLTFADFFILQYFKFTPEFDKPQLLPCVAYHMVHASTKSVNSCKPIVPDQIFKSFANK